jgi:hypothetical protein
VGTENGPFCTLDVSRGKRVSVSSVCEVQDKLALIAGPGKLQTKISEARGRLARINSNRWRSPLAPGRIKRFLYRAQQPKPEEVDDVREAYRQFCEEKLAFAKRVVSQIEYLRRSDEDFHRETISELIRLLEPLRPFLLRAEQQGGGDRG